MDQQPLVLDSGYHSGYSARDRRLNPAEFPSLSAAAYAAQQQQSKQQQQQAANTSQVHIPLNASKIGWLTSSEAPHFVWCAGDGAVG